MQTVHGACETTSCTPNPCKKIKGACCLPNGGCIVMPQDDCNHLGGIYKGDGVPCTATTCEPIGQTGACCLPNGGGCIQATSLDCFVIGGISWASGAPCTATTCPSTQPEGCCCLADGTCIMTTKLKCDLAGGSCWQWCTCSQASVMVSSAVSDWSVTLTARSGGVDISTCRL